MNKISPTFKKGSPSLLQVFTSRCSNQTADTYRRPANVIDNNCNKKILNQTQVNSNSTITSSVRRTLFKRNYFTTISCIIIYIISCKCYCNKPHVGPDDQVNSNSTVTSLVSHTLFKRDYFTVISFNTLNMKKRGNKLIAGRRKCVLCGKHNRREITIFLDHQIYYEIKLKVTVNFSVCALTIRYRIRINKFTLV